MTTKSIVAPVPALNKSRRRNAMFDRMDYQLITRTAEVAHPQAEFVDVGQASDGEFWACWISPAGYPDWIYFRL